MSRKGKKPTQPPDKLLEEAARDLADLQREFSAVEAGAAARERSQVETLTRAVQAFADAGLGFPGASDHHCSLRWDDNGERVTLVEQQPDGVMVSVADPSGAWAMLLHVSALPLVVEAGQKAMREESERVDELARDREKQVWRVSRVGPAPGGEALVSEWDGRQS